MVRQSSRARKKIDYAQIEGDLDPELLLSDEEPDDAPVERTSVSCLFVWGIGPRLFQFFCFFCCFFFFLMFAGVAAVSSRFSVSVRCPDTLIPTPLGLRSLPLAIQRETATPRRCKPKITSAFPHSLPCLRMMDLRPSIGLSAGDR